MNKKFKLTSMVFASTLLLTSFSTTNVEAKNNNSLTVSATPKIDYNNFQVYNSDGSITIYDNLQDMQKDLAFGKSSLPNKSSILSARTWEKLVSTQKKNKVFLGYSKFTKTWTKASSYTLLKSETFSTGFTTKWDSKVNLSYSTSSGINTTIKANKKKFSKIAGYADITIKRYKVVHPKMSSSFYKNEVTYRDRYTQVKYKK